MRYLIVRAAAAYAMMAASAMAGPVLPDAVATVTADATGAPQSLSGAPPLAVTVDAAIDGFGSGESAASALGAPSAVVAAHESGTGLNYTNAIGGAAATLTYYLTVSGLGGDVPLAIGGFVSGAVLSSNNVSIASARVRISDLTTSSTLLDAYACANSIFCSGASQSGTLVVTTTGTQDFEQQFLVTANDVLQVTLEASVSVAGLDTAFASTYASANAYFAIDPTFLAENPDYALVLSAGMGAAPVPAPGSLALFGMALSALATIRCRGGSATRRG